MLSDPQALIVEYHQSLEKKQRNLTKRKAKLDQYKANLAKGLTLNDDQKRAVAKYDDVVTSIALFSEIIETTQDFTKKLEKSLKQVESQIFDRQQSSLINGITDYILLQSFLKKINQPLVKEAIIIESSEEKYQVLSFMKNIFINSPDRVEYENRHKSFAKQANLGTLRRHIYSFLSESNEKITFPKNTKLGPMSYKEAIEFCYSIMNDERVIAALEGKAFQSPIQVPESIAESITCESTTPEVENNKENNMLNPVASVTGNASFNFLHDSKLKKEEKEVPVYKSEFLPVSTFLDKTNENDDSLLQKPIRKSLVGDHANIMKNGKSEEMSQFKLPNSNHDSSRSHSLKMDSYNDQHQHRTNFNNMDNGHGYKQSRYPMNSHNMNRGNNSNNGGGRNYRRNDFGENYVNGGGNHHHQNNHHQNHSNFHMRPQHLKQTRVETS